MLCYMNIYHNNFLIGGLLKVIIYYCMHQPGLEVVDECFAASKERVSACVAVSVPKIKQCYSYHDILGKFLFNVIHNVDV